MVVLRWPRALEVRARRVGLSSVVVGRRAVHLGLGLVLVHTQFVFELRLGEVRRRAGVRLDVAPFLFAEQRLQAQQPGDGDGQQAGHDRLAGQHEQRAERQRQQRAGHHGHAGGQHRAEVLVLFASTCNPTTVSVKTTQVRLYTAVYYLYNYNRHTIQRIIIIRFSCF